MKVSVCIPVYGVEKYIERCARSLFEQTMKDDIEFIFVDDCTPDKSIEILKKVLSEYPERASQVKIIRHEVNKGLTGARNTALQHVSGEYIIHCDSDDWVDKNLYEVMYGSAVKTQAEAVACAIKIEYTDKKNKIVSFRGKTVGELFSKDFNSCIFNSTVNKMYCRRIALDPEIESPEHITMAEDLLRTTQILLKCTNLVICDNVYYHYFCGNPGSSTMNFSRKSFDSAREAIQILQEQLQKTYPDLALALQGQVLFSALRVPEITTEEIHSFYSQEIRWKVIFCSKLPLVKRLFLFVSFFSVPLAQLSCRWSIKMAERSRTGR